LSRTWVFSSADVRVAALHVFGVVHEVMRAS
jgi:hypothetical protein